VTSVRVPSLYAYALGRDLAIVRMSRAMPLVVLAQRLQTHVHYVMDLEAGLAPLSATVVADWCAALRVKPDKVMARAACEASPDVYGLIVELRTIAESRSRESRLLDCMGKWALEMLEISDSPQIVLSSSEIAKLAAHWGVSKGELVLTLCDFVPLCPGGVRDQRQGNGLQANVPAAKEESRDEQ
jgi:hypothetical protein